MTRRLPRPEIVAVEVYIRYIDGRLKPTIIHAKPGEIADVVAYRYPADGPTQLVAWFPVDGPR